ncbi:hypothetical protein KAW65_02130 [candidate division WOR-3 bacterium]|nr:hypothetical protein [candidate division WOR-3 bacterium]
MKRLTILLGAILLFIIMGCSPKGASQDALNRMEQAKLAAESAESKAKSLERQRLALESEKLEKQAKVESLERELKGEGE